MLQQRQVLPFLTEAKRIPHGSKVATGTSGLTTFQTVMNMSYYEKLINAPWNEDGLSSSKRYDRYHTMSSFEPTPLPEQCFSVSTGDDYHLDGLPSQVTLLPEFSSSEPIADSCDDDFFDEFPSWAQTQKRIHDLDCDLNQIKIEPLFLSKSSPCSNDIEKVEGVTVDESESPSANRRWRERYNDLVAYKNRFGNCCVPSQWSENPPLAQWVKRQRYQLKLQKEGQHSTMSFERKIALDNLGFTWDPHTAFWEERLGELEHFREENGHANIPTKYPQNRQLAIWAKVSRPRKSQCLILICHFEAGIHNHFFAW